MKLSTEKVCAKCKVSKDFIEFYKNRSTTDGYLAYKQNWKNFFYQSKICFTYWTFILVGNGQLRTLDAKLKKK